MNTQTEVMQRDNGSAAAQSRKTPNAESVLRPPVDIYETGEGIVGALDFLQADDVG